MPTARLSPLDASFLAVETPTAHMHVGWVAVFEPPLDAPAPTFAQLRDHIAARLPRAPRYRQVLHPTPLGLGAPIWVDDHNFEIARHVVRGRARRLTDVVDWFMSKPLRRERPLWQVCIADMLDDGRIGVVGKAHHCMADGIAAVELATLLVDPEPDPAPPEPDGWLPRPPPDAPALLAGALGDFVRSQLDTSPPLPGPAANRGPPGDQARLWREAERRRARGQRRWGSRVPEDAGRDARPPQGHGAGQRTAAGRYGGARQQDLVHV